MSSPTGTEYRRPTATAVGQSGRSRTMMRSALASRTASRRSADHRGLKNAGKLSVPSSARPAQRHGGIRCTVPSGSCSRSGAHFRLRATIVTRWPAAVSARQIFSVRTSHG